MCVAGSFSTLPSLRVLTSSYESSSRALVPGFSPSWPNAPCCHESESNVKIGGEVNRGLTTAGAYRSKTVRANAYQSREVASEGQRVLSEV